MTEIKGVGRRRRIQLLDDLRNGTRYWGLNVEAEDKIRWKRVHNKAVFFMMRLKDR